MSWSKISLSSYFIISLRFPSNRPCSCNPSGSIDECNVETGRCVCKDNVEGFNCERQLILSLVALYLLSYFRYKKIPGCILISFRCKPGFFNLESSNPRGCTPCFCFGHSSVCTNAVGYSVYSITSTFETGKVYLSFCPLEF